MIKSKDHILSLIVIFEAIFLGTKQWPKALFNMYQQKEYTDNIYLVCI